MLIVCCLVLYNVLLYGLHIWVLEQLEVPVLLSFEGWMLVIITYHVFSHNLEKTYDEY